MMVIDTKFDIGETVYLKTDNSQSPRIVFSYTVFRNEIIYRLCFGTTTSEHYDFELSREKDTIIATTN